ncbi:unnamed protein product [Closterium sp. NIES-64]|nr:unnamed protein product [Closterium sp. NIES-64]
MQPWRLLYGPVAYPCGPDAALPGPGAALPGPGTALPGPGAALPGLGAASAGLVAYPAAPALPFPAPTLPLPAPPPVLAFDAEGRAIDFDVWVDDLQLFLQCDRADGLSLFDLTSGASPAPTADADATVRSQWATRDAAARLAVRRHLPTSELTLATALRFQLSSAPRTPAPMYITLYDIVTRLPDSLRVVRDHFLSVCPTTLTVDLLEKALLAAEKSIVAVGASRGDPRTPVFEGRSALRLPRARDAAPARAKGARALEGVARAAEVAVAAIEGVGVVVGVVAGVEVSVAAVEAEAEAAVAVGAEVAGVAAEEEAAAEEAELVGVALHRGSAPVVRGGGTGPCTYVLRTGDRAGEQCGGAHSTLRCFGRLTDAWRHQFPEATEIPRWGELSRAGVAIFDLDFDAILAARYAVTISDEGDCYWYFPPDPGIETAALGTGEAAALGASEDAALGASASASTGGGESALSGTASASASHTFTLDSGASRSFFRDRTTLTPLGRPVAVSLADPSGGPVLAHFPTVLPYPAAPSGTQSGLYLPSFSTNLVSGADLQDAGGHERYFLLVVDDYSRYTTVFPLRSKGDVTEVLINWIRAARLQLRQSFGSDFPVLRLHSDRGGEFSSGLLRAYCRAQGIR